MPVQTYVRAAGICFLLSIVVGSFGEAYVPSTLIVAHDAAATANNVRVHATLFRVGFAAYLIEALCDVVLALLLYAILRPVQKDLSLMAAFFGLVGTAIYAVGEISFLSMSAHGLFGYSANVSMVFYGAASLLRGYLIYRSDYLPKFLGVLLMIAALGFVAKTFLFVLAPGYASDFLLAPMFVALTAITAWFLVKGVDLVKWEAMATR